MLAIAYRRGAPQESYLEFVADCEGDFASVLEKRADTFSMDFFPRTAAGDARVHDLADRLGSVAVSAACDDS